MTNHQQSLAVMQHHNAEAACMSHSCPWCEKQLPVKAAFHQATRQEPTRFLCYEAWCVGCQMTFPVKQPQLVLEPTTAQTPITVGSKVRHITKGWVADVTSIYTAPGYGCLTAGLRFDVGVSACALDMLELA